MTTPTSSSIKAEQQKLISSLVEAMYSFFTTYLSIVDIPVPPNKTGILSRFVNSNSLSGVQLMRSESNMAFGAIAWLELLSIYKQSELCKEDAPRVMRNLNTYINFANQSYNKKVDPEFIRQFALKRSMMYSDIISKGDDLSPEINRESQVKVNILVALFHILSKKNEDEINETTIRRIAAAEKALSEFIRGWMKENLLALSGPVF